VRAGVARHHSEQHALADTAAGEEPDALAAPDGEQRVDGAHADIERLRDGLAGKRIDRLPGKAHALVALERAEPVERPRGAIDDTAEKLRAYAHGACTVAGYDARVRFQPVQIARRHQEQAVAREPDDLGFDAHTVAGHHVAVVADGGLAADGFERQPDHAGEIPFDRRGRNLLHAAERPFQAVAPVCRELCAGGRSDHWPAPFEPTPSAEGCVREGARSSPSAALTIALMRL